MYRKPPRSFHSCSGVANREHARLAGPVRALERVSCWSKMCTQPDMRMSHSRTCAAATAHYCVAHFPPL